MIAPAIHFSNGDCAKAIELYKEAFGMTVHSIRYYRDAPPDSGMPMAEAMRDWVMHAELEICGSRVNMSDSDEAVTAGDMILLNVFFSSSEDVKKAYHALEAQGEVRVALGPQFFSPMYGSVRDRYGVHWQLIAE